MLKSCATPPASRPRHVHLLGLPQLELGAVPARHVGGERGVAHDLPVEGQGREGELERSGGLADGADPQLDAGFGLPGLEPAQRRGDVALGSEQRVHPSTDRRVARDAEELLRGGVPQLGDPLWAEDGDRQGRRADQHLEGRGEAGDLARGGDLCRAQLAHAGRELPQQPVDDGREDQGPEDVQRLDGDRASGARTLCQHGDGHDHRGGGQRGDRQHAQRPPRQVRQGDADDEQRPGQHDGPRVLNPGARHAQPQQRQPKRQHRRGDFASLGEAERHAERHQGRHEDRERGGAFPGGFRQHRSDDRNGGHRQADPEQHDRALQPRDVGRPEADRVSRRAPLVHECHLPVASRKLAVERVEDEPFGRKRRRPRNRDDFSCDFGAFC
ncbi:MAG: hypothetical protein IAE78_13080 [Myxococcus sp.]|nr:hypothetical protein [Myxococcus sp.]